jgi:hypothetical protein
VRTAFLELARSSFIPSAAILSGLIETELMPEGQGQNDKG